MKILHVEDEQDIREIASVALGAIGGHELRQCANGAEAISSCEAFGPEVLLIDVMMPGLTGPETLAALRAIPAMAAVPAVFMTAKVQPNEVKTLMSIGARGVISKPFDPMTLSDELTRILN